MDKINELLAKISAIVGFPVELQREVKDVPNFKKCERVYITTPNKTGDTYYLGFRIANPSGSNVISTFMLTQLEDCAAITISHRVKVEEPWRNKGINTIGNQIRQEIVKANGYDALICTVRDDNEHEIKTMNRNTFSRIATVNSHYDAVTLGLWLKQFPKEQN